MKCDCDKNAKTNVQVFLPEVKVEFPEKVSNLITMETEDGKLFIELKYPSMGDQKNISAESDDAFRADKLLIRTMISKIYNEEKVFDVSSIPDDDFVEWVNELPKQVKDSIEEFLSNMPSLKHTIKYKCSECGKEDEYTLKGLLSFFI